MKFLSYPAIAILLLTWCALASADHKPEAQWSWHVQSAGADESLLSVYQRDQMLGIYEIDCDLTDLSEGERVDGNASLNLLKPDARGEGLLVIICNVGAHSQQITIFDLVHKSMRPAFTATGSYTASWELQDGELWIGYDEPCDTGPSVECPDGFVTRFVQYPDPKAE